LIADVNQGPNALDDRNLRVLFLATRDWYHPKTTGGDNTLWETARYLASVGHRVTFLAASYPGARARELLEGIEVVRLGGIHWLWLRTFLYYMLRCRGRFDVVIAEGFGGSRVPRFAPLYVHEPIITEWHQIHRDLFANQYPQVAGPLLNFLERVTAWVHRNTMVRAGTRDWLLRFTEIGFKAQNVFVVPVSIREEWLTTGESANGHPTTVVWLGKLRRYKCPHHAVAAMVQIVREVPEARLVLAIRQDDEDYERGLRSLVAQSHLQDHIEFRINITEDEKRVLLRSACALVVTSAVEGFGIVVLEANACGVPVVASSGVPEGAVRDHFNGLRYPFGDVNALAAALVRTLTNDELRRNLSSNAIEFAKQFEWRIVGAQYETVVKALARGLTDQDWIQGERSRELNVSTQTRQQ
jgi:glycosyltransferase involved in cell wall biosynthesis